MNKSDFIKNEKRLVAAVVVAFNGEETIEKCILSVVSQVDMVIVVDNASSDRTLEILYSIQIIYPTIKIIKNKQNVGLAAALNQGIDVALFEQYQWVLTLDDDSVAEPDMIFHQLQAYQKLPLKIQDQVGIVAPNYVTSKGIVYKEKKPFFVVATITSGQLVKTDIINMIGKLKSDFFIECIDQEFCLRVKKFNLKTLLVPKAILNQRLGNPTLRWFLWKKIAIANHAAFRYYYLYKNSFFLYKNYFFISPGWVIKNIISNFYLLLKIAFFEKEKFKKFQMIVIGCKEGLLEKQGL